MSCTVEGLVRLLGAYDLLEKQAFQFEDEEVVERLEGALGEVDSLELKVAALTRENVQLRLGAKVACEEVRLYPNLLCALSFCLLQTISEKISQEVQVATGGRHLALHMLCELFRSKLAEATLQAKQSEEKLERATPHEAFWSWLAIASRFRRKDAESSLEQCKGD